MRTIEKEIFKFEELTEDAKEKAREWRRSYENEDHTFAEFVLEDAYTIAELFGLNIRLHPVKLLGGGQRLKPSIYYSGFYSIMDGACFEGYYSYKKDCLKKVKEYVPKDEELHQIVSSIVKIQKRNSYSLIANTKQSGRYYHSDCMSVNVSRSDDKEMSVNAQDDLAECLRDFADWIYKRLENEYNYTMSDENIDECIITNEYEFDIDGNIV